MALVVLALLAILAAVLIAALSEFTRGEKFGGLVVTEVNPDHDPGGELLAALVRTVAGALAAWPEHLADGSP